MATEIIKTIMPGGGGDFTTLNAWIATIATRDLVANDEVQVAECFSGGNLVTPTVQLLIPSGITTDATRFVVIRSGPGEHIVGGPWTSSKPRAEWALATTGLPFGVIVKDFRMSGIQLRGSGPSGRILECNTQDPNAHYFIEECFFRSDGPQAAQFPFVILLNATAGSCGGNGPNGRNRIVNNIFFYSTPDSTAEGFGHILDIRGVITKVDVFNNTFITTASADQVVCVITGADNVVTDNNYFRIVNGSAYFLNPTFLIPGANDATSNTEAITPALRSISYDATNFVTATDDPTTLNVRLKVGSSLRDGGAHIVGVLNDVTGRLR